MESIHQARGPTRAKSKHGARSPRPSFTAKLRRRARSLRLAELESRVFNGKTSKRGAQSPHPGFTAKLRRRVWSRILQSLKAASQHHCSVKMRGSKPASLASLQCQDAELEARVSTSPQCQNVGLKARVPASLQCQYAKPEACVFNYRRALRFSYNCPHCQINYCPHNEGS